jgi:hypothetical protein
VICACARTSTLLLWHIPLSHYNEKARWALDYKRIAHHRQVLGADYLIRAWRATGRGTLPILFLDGRAIGDSTHIIAALEPEPPLSVAWPFSISVLGQPQHGGGVSGRSGTPSSHRDVHGPGRFDGTLRPHGPGGFTRGHIGLSENRRRDRAALGRLRREDV